MDWTVLLAGSSGGIGSQLAAMFPSESIVQHYYKRRPHGLDGALSADLSDHEATKNMVEQALKKLGRIDILVNAAGISSDAFAHKFSPGEWKSVIDVNLVGTFNLIHAVLPSMRANRFGRIVVLSSVVCQRPVMGTSAYSASKAGLIGLTRTIAVENASMGITCNCIALGYFDAGMLYRIPAEVREQIRDSIPMKRFGHVAEIYRTIQYLVETEYVTGQVLPVNGGLHMG